MLPTNPPVLKVVNFSGSYFHQRTCHTFATLSEVVTIQTNKCSQFLLKLCAIVGLKRASETIYISVTAE
jgi:hypothetical protein